MIMGILLAVISLILGFWSKPNAVESQKKYIGILSFVVFMPISLYFGYEATASLNIPIHFSPLFGAVGYISSKPLEKLLRKKLRVGDGPAAQYFLALAQNDGEQVKRAFMINALELRSKRLSERPSVDDLITAYNAARKEFGLEAAVVNENEIPWV